MKIIALVLLNVLACAVGTEKELSCSLDKVATGQSNKWIVVKSSRDNQIDEVTIGTEIKESDEMEIEYTINDGDSESTPLCADAQGNEGLIPVLLMNTLKLNEQACPIKQQKQKPQSPITGTLDIDDDFPRKFDVSMQLKKMSAELLSIDLVCRAK